MQFLGAETTSFISCGEQSPVKKGMWKSSNRSGVSQHRPCSVYSMLRTLYLGQIWISQYPFYWNYKISTCSASQKLWFK